VEVRLLSGAPVLSSKAFRSGHGGQASREGPFFVDHTNVERGSAV
jgi:hypothetical protein